jgi:hypothetical protein
MRNINYVRHAYRKRILQLFSQKMDLTNLNSMSWPIYFSNILHSLTPSRSTVLGKRHRIENFASQPSETHTNLLF